MTDVTLVDLCIFACSEAFRDNGEIVATGVGPVPRIAAGLAKLTHTPGLMMTDGEAYLVEQPVPLGPRKYDDRKPAGYLPFSRFFDSAVWSGRRHAMVTPTQLDRFGQINLSYMGGTYNKPKTQMLGVRGFPGNTIYHPNSFFFPAHGPRVFVPEVDMISGVGYNPAKRVPGGNYSGVDLRCIVTNLCVMDFGGPEHAIRVVSLHPGVTFEEVQAATGFELHRLADLPETPLPTAEALEVIAALDPHNIRATVIKDNPPAKRAA
ncbi:Acyl CoA:acetate/3-ketoacid CoA transferase beta subunit-like protein (plasmid) [Novosphingobium aromaticivorans DSM 12444]|uniref:Acyl CoA:acetate/3-ketoacid CoA transferase beta subunit-like protein n=1 Tax=Novosphingobium aromaticivorans (strain ATCC 700278 / DSM 12444 / CCUG 56034 / CIP 105152 / NBRC 16084 / F199) TaxID=279238 RepID=A4XFA0_NOVAD|nr:acyl CoA--acetate/3-ketoacid CoA transferase subunit beta [Novosphingobium aromaticivorans]ABP64611.1 Acyl CoA:acetate/3-ketoacid CoA transferase beta subunit-like protein [Novosphingobium aromaticivorans DSM 12444]SCY92268.1 glutaconate CoA-transferase subunit B [Novosphingobium aromaticivorans]